MDTNPGLHSGTAKADLLAASKDLRFLARSLALLAEVSVNDPASPPGEIRLGRFADELALEVAALAERITAKVFGAELRPRPRRPKGSVPAEAAG